MSSNNWINITIQSTDKDIVSDTSANPKTKTYKYNIGVINAYSKNRRLNMFGKQGNNVGDIKWIIRERLFLS